MRAAATTAPSTIVATTIAPMMRSRRLPRASARLKGSSTSIKISSICSQRTQRTRSSELPLPRHWGWSLREGSRVWGLLENRLDRKEKAPRRRGRVRQQPEGERRRPVPVGGRRGHHLCRPRGSTTAHCRGRGVQGVERTAKQVHRGRYPGVVRKAMGDLRRAL